MHLRRGLIFVFAGFLITSLILTDAAAQSKKNKPGFLVRCGTSSRTYYVGDDMKRHLVSSDTVAAHLGLKRKDRVNFTKKQCAQYKLGSSIKAQKQKVEVSASSVARFTTKSPEGFATHTYSQLQAFSHDNKYVLLIVDSQYRVFNTATKQLITWVILNDINTPRWHPRENAVIYFDNAQRLKKINVDTKTTQTIVEFPLTIRPNQSHEELSRDGRFMAGLGINSKREQVIFSYDVIEKRMYAQLTLGDLYDGTCAPDSTYGEVEPDWVGVSPLGKYMVVQWKRDGTNRCSGLETFDIKTGTFVGRVYDGHQHGDLAIDKDGTEFFMTFEQYHPSGNLALGMRKLPGTSTVQSPTYLTVYPDWFGSHISCQGPAGVCLVTNNYSDGSRTRQNLEGELFLQYTDGKIRRLNEHKSSACGYWVQPRASISRDGRFVIFATDGARDTGKNGCSQSDLGRGDVFIVELNSDEVKNGVGAVEFSPQASVAEPAAPGAEQRSPPSTDANLGKTGPLPETTYTLKSGETVTLQSAQPPWDVYFEHTIGSGKCQGADFINYEIYKASSAHDTYTLIGTHRGAAVGQFVSGAGMESDGCAKGRFKYALGTGAEIAAVCVQDSSAKRYCVTLPITR